MGPVRARHPHPPRPGSSFALSLALFEPRPAPRAPQLTPPPCPIRIGQRYPQLRRLLDDQGAIFYSTSSCNMDQMARASASVVLVGSPGRACCHSCMPPVWRALLRQPDRGPGASSWRCSRRCVALPSRTPRHGAAEHVVACLPSMIAPCAAAQAALRPPRMALAF